MTLVKLDLMSKNNLKRGSYLYVPIVRIDGKYYRCHSLKVSKVITKHEVDINSLIIQAEILPQYHEANGLNNL